MLKTDRLPWVVVDLGNDSSGRNPQMKFSTPRAMTATARTLARSQPVDRWLGADPVRAGCRPCRSPAGRSPVGTWSAGVSSIGPGPEAVPGIDPTAQDGTGDPVPEPHCAPGGTPVSPRC